MKIKLDERKIKNYYTFTNSRNVIKNKIDEKDRSIATRIILTMKSTIPHMCL